MVHGRGWPESAAPGFAGRSGLVGRLGLAELLGLAGGADRDLARLGLLADRDADLEHAFAVAGLDRVGVEVVAEPDAPGEAAEPALAGDRVLTLGLGLLAGGAHGEHALVDGHVDLLRVHAGDVEPQDELAVAAEAVHRQGRGITGADGAGAERAADDPVEVAGARVESRQVHRCYLLGGLPRLVVSPCTSRKLTAQVIYFLLTSCQITCFRVYRGGDG